jgi:hypothetical protein
VLENVESDVKCYSREGEIKCWRRERARRIAGVAEVER